MHCSTLNNVYGLTEHSSDLINEKLNMSDLQNKELEELTTKVGKDLLLEESPIALRKQNTPLLKSDCLEYLKHRVLNESPLLNKNTRTNFQQSDVESTSLYDSFQSFSNNDDSSSEEDVIELLSSPIILDKRKGRKYSECDVVIISDSDSDTHSEKEIIIL
ncbi:hypothetical protein O9G_004706 [Rozella allomycis CSF55]|uniref:Uncharacterized protein n=1 Tax=Rozella allomycis (strain CSF55) TaxID=988480 RepID=A0A075AY81_ROZAC|nr:hypothetical protein O9G_004706 [Rozella allomycis CSF55]|eukprot:EPZ35227.1 hypothetical protein O9G_004706 [Rozella allomycis CSF55]